MKQTNNKPIKKNLHSINKDNMLRLKEHSYAGVDVKVKALGSAIHESTVNVGKYCSIASNVTFYVNGNHPTHHFSMFPFPGEALFSPVGKGCPSVGNDVWIGDGVVVCTGVHISDGAVVDTNAVVTQNVPPYAIVAGNPARVVRFRFADALIDRLLKVQWWDFPHDVVVAHLVPTAACGVEETIRVAESIRENIHESIRDGNRGSALALYRLQNNTVLREYARLCQTPSDINEHLPTLKCLASRCTSAVEMGVRSVVSTWALLAGLVENGDGAKEDGIEGEKGEEHKRDKGNKEKRLVCVDISACDMSAPRAIAACCGVDLSFVQGDSATVSLPESDMMFIDTWHVYGHLIRELRMHSTRVRKFIAMHDTQIDGEHGESLRVGWDPRAQAVSSGYPEEDIRRGLKPAIADFLGSDDGVNWCVALEHTHNNGLTVLCRRSRSEDIAFVKSVDKALFV